MEAAGETATGWKIEIKEEQKKMKKKTFALIRRDRNVQDAEVSVDLFDVPASLMEKGEEAVLDYLKKIAADYLRTEEGKTEFSFNCECFGWNDFAGIPDSFLKKYGVIVHPYDAIEVDGNEQIGL